MAELRPLFGDKLLDIGVGSFLQLSNDQVKEEGLDRRNSLFFCGLEKGWLKQIVTSSRAIDTKHWCICRLLAPFSIPVHTI